ncbi:MAG: AI-2E family transporter [Hydrogenophilaceae bacterium]|nr:AI-2E family transporter [Hydrogenophilaceae bacterium]
MVVNATKHEWAAWGLMAAALVFTLKARLLPALLAGLLVYELVALLAPKFVGGRLSHSRAKIIVVALISATVLAILIGAVVGAVAYYKAEGGSYAALLAKMAEVIENSRALLPSWLAAYLPQGDESQIRAALVEWLREHAQEIKTFGGSAGHALAMVIIGLIIGSFVALNEGREHHMLGPLAQAMSARVLHLGQAFRKVVFAQVRISLLNTFLTGLYLGVVLPSFGVELPFVKTMIVITFVAGLMPVLGNLISNTVITIISFNYSLQVAFASLAFLVIIHKLEYFVNARIIGGQIKAYTWELLTAMLVMEAAFGVAGVIAAPVFYAYLKRELSERNLI